MTTKQKLARLAWNIADCAVAIVIVIVGCMILFGGG
jgi:hypothetical protein